MFNRTRNFISQKMTPKNNTLGDNRKIDLKKMYDYTNDDMGNALNTGQRITVTQLGTDNPPSFENLEGMSISGKHFPTNDNIFKTDTDAKFRSGEIKDEEEQMEEEFSLTAQSVSKLKITKKGLKNEKDLSDIDLTRTPREIPTKKQVKADNIQFKTF